MCHISLQVIWCCAVGDVDRRSAVQGCGLLCHNLGSGQQQSAAACARQLPRELQTAPQAMLVSRCERRKKSEGRNERNVLEKMYFKKVERANVKENSELIQAFIQTIYRNCKPRNRPSFRQILLHLDIASADILSTPQETYFKSQVSFVCPLTQTHLSRCSILINFGQQAAKE